MKSISLADILKLDVSQRIQLAEEIWDSIAACPDALELTDSQREELDRRLAAYRADPAAGSPWDDVRSRIAQSK
jgi:putative addiction module component (TIGR02574 family)